VDKFYLEEHRPGGEVSTVGLYYSREEAEEVIAQLRELPEKQGCEYVLVRPADHPPTPDR
jgi:hypothetical protein